MSKRNLSITLCSLNCSKILQTIEKYFHNDVVSNHSLIIFYTHFLTNFYQVCNFYLYKHSV